MKKYIQNKLTIIGNDEQIKTVREFLRSKTETDEGLIHIDFNNIIEMPSSLKIEFEPEVDLARQLLFEQSFYQEGLLREEAWQIFAEFKRLDQDEYIESAIQVQYNIQKTGHAFGHSWIKENWGTEGNAYSQKLEAENIICFNTNYAPATKIIEALSSNFPDVNFTHNYTVEDEYGLPF